MTGGWDRIGSKGALGDNYVQCDRSGFKTLASKCVIDPESGGVVRADFADKVNPQQFLKLKREDRTVRYSRPWGLTNFVDKSLPPDTSLLG